MTTRRHFTAQLGALAVWGASLPRAARAQIPQTVRLLVGFPAGGATDSVARRLADQLRGRLATQVIVENRPGAGGQLAVNALKSFPADGLTLLLTPPAPFAIYPFTYKRLAYAPEDVVPVSLVCNFAFALAAGPAVPARVTGLGDFLDWARQNPAQANYGSPAAGAPPHLVASMLALNAGVPLTHVPYRGDAPGLQDLMGGQVSAYSSTLGSFVPHLGSGRMRLLAVSGPTRSPFAPDTPTYREQGFPIDITEWFGLFALNGTPASTVQQIAAVVKQAVEQPDFVQALAGMGMAAHTTSPAAMAAQMRQETEFWRAEVRRIGFTADS